MSQDINKVPFNLIPSKWAFDPEIGPFIRELLNILNQSRERVGGDTDIVNNVTQISNTNFYAQALLRDEQSETSFFYCDEYNSDRQFDAIPELARFYKKRVSSLTQASDYDMYSARNCEIKLPSKPSDDSQVIVINEDGTEVKVNANGNKIRVRNGLDDSIVWCNAGQSIHFHWFDDGPWWAAI